MRTYDNGYSCGFTVTFSERDSQEFSESWPCSTVHGKGSFSFAANGDLIDLTGSAETNDGDDWAAFSKDCQVWGGEHIGALVRRHEKGLL